MTYFSIDHDSESTKRRGNIVELLYDGVNDRERSEVTRRSMKSDYLRYLRLNDLFRGAKGSKI